jgi:coenzyme F420-reducing hydrogenase delta subunit
MREVAAGLRRDALAGLSASEREQFVDTLTAIKANLSRLGTVRQKTKKSDRSND